jgi:hypothetical protein
MTALAAAASSGLARAMADHASLISTALRVCLEICKSTSAATFFCLDILAAAGFF